MTNLASRRTSSGEVKGASPPPSDARASLRELVLARHGSTPWSRDGRHTGRTDLHLDEEGRAQARRLAQLLAGERFSRVLTSPLTRARETCELAGFGGGAIVDERLAEWDYGDYEGRTTAEIRAERPSWHLFFDGCPNGESAEAVGRRIDSLLDGLDHDPDLEGGRVICFAHGHVLRVLAARWCAMAASDARLLHLDTARLCRLGYEHEDRVILAWNL